MTDKDYQDQPEPVEQVNDSDLLRKFEALESDYQVPPIVRGEPRETPEPLEKNEESASRAQDVAVEPEGGTVPDEPAAPSETLESEEDEAEEGYVDPYELREPPDDGLRRRWYALHAHSGQEGNVREMLMARAQELEQPELLTNVFVPVEEVEVTRSGQKRVSRHKCFPGYVLLQLPEHPEQYPELWHMIKDTPSVTGFIGSRVAPVPLEDSEVQAIIEVVRGERERPKPKLDFEVGERVRINDGPFANFLGRIEEINADRGIVKVMVEIFERQTSVEVEFWQVEQI